MLTLQSLDQVAAVLLGPDGRILSWNCGAQALFGYTPPEVLGSPVERLHLGEGHSALVRCDIERASRERYLRADGWRMRKDGSRIRVCGSISALGDDGAPDAFLALMWPHEAERSRPTGLPHLDQLVAGVTDYAIFSLDPSGRVMSWNDGARNIKGYEPDEIIGHHFSRFYPADAIARGWPDYELRVATTEGRFEDEGWRVRKDGSSFWANVVITALRDPGGTLLGFCKITRDLSERRAQEEQLRLSEQRLRALMETLTDHAIFMLDANGFITCWTTGCELAFGYPAAEIMWKHVSNLYRSEDIAANLPWTELAAAAAEGQYESEGWRVGKQGTPVRKRIAIRTVYDAQGAPSGYAHIVREIPEGADLLKCQRNTARALYVLLQAQLHNRLVPIRNALDLLKRRLPADPVTESMLDTIHREVGEFEQVLRALSDEATGLRR